MSFYYNDLVRDVADRALDDYQDYLDNLEPYDEQLSAEDYFDQENSINHAIDNVLIPTAAIWCVIQEHCANPIEVLNGEAPDYDGEDALIRFYDDCYQVALDEV